MYKKTIELTLINKNKIFVSIIPRILIEIEPVNIASAIGGNFKQLVQF